MGERGGEGEVEDRKIEKDTQCNNTRAVPVAESEQNTPAFIDESDDRKRKSDSLRQLVAVINCDILRLLIKLPPDFLQ